MNREIKFRLWDVRNNSYRNYCNEKLLFISGPGTTSLGKFECYWTQLFKDTLPAELEGVFLFYDDKPQLIIEQYTGLKDKHGKEIYEGDIVKYVILPNPFKEIEYDVRLIEWEQMSSRFTVPNFCSGCPAEFMEVTGNIHENPELLKT